MKNARYFTAEEIAPRTWHIRYGFTDREHVRCYLIEGRDYALVIDTMNGYGNLRAFCETLTEKPLKLVNTHFHLDHTGGNFDFDACYMHHLDIKYFYDCSMASPGQMLERARAEAFEEHKPHMEVSDFCVRRHMPVYPLYDGDRFDLGGREIIVVDVGGHTPGSIVLIDPVTRIAFTGDACNGNTLLDFGNSLPVERYLKNLLYFKHFQSMFDVMYGGHQIMTPGAIDEGIEMCARIIAGTDDRDVRAGIFGTPVVYGSKPLSDTPEGPHFNMSYDPDKIMDDGGRPQKITLEPAKSF
jgi:hydroxyacylglutathione hydrolase